MKIQWRGEELSVSVTPYTHPDSKPQVALVLRDKDGMQYGVATVAIPGAFLLENQVIIDNRYDGLIEALEEGNVIQRPAAGFTRSGYCTFPIYDLTDEATVALLGVSDGNEGGD